MILDKISNVLTKLSERIGNEAIVIPPMTAQVIAHRRMAKLNTEDLHGKYGYLHTGWAELAVPCDMEDVIDTITYHLLCMELATRWDVPVSFISALQLHIGDEPARFYIKIKGIMPLIQDNKSTPALCRVAYEGAHHGLWEMEELFQLPSPLVAIPTEMMDDVDVTDFIDEPDVTFA
tara:strand:+ start:830 stop:1360 length:531 start_codon:yes stop_codon:yes gene_type:complete